MNIQLQDILLSTGWSLQSYYDPLYKKIKEYQKTEPGVFDLWVKPKLFFSSRIWSKGMAHFALALISEHLPRHSRWRSTAPKIKIFWVVCKVTADSLLWTRTKPITTGTCPQTASMQSFHYPWECTNRRMRILAELKYTHSFADSKRQMEGWLYDPCINIRLVYLDKILVYW